MKDKKTKNARAVKGDKKPLIPFLGKGKKEPVVPVAKSVPRSSAVVPIKEIREYVALLDSGEFFLLMEVDSVNISLKTHEEQEILRSRFAGMLNAHQKSVQFTSVSERVDIGPYVTKIKDNTDRSDNVIVKTAGDSIHSLLATIVQRREVNSRKSYIALYHKPLFTKGYSEEDEWDVAKRDLTDQANIIYQNLRAIGLSSIIINSTSIIRAYRQAFNFFNTERQPMRTDLASFTAPALTYEDAPPLGPAPDVEVLNSPPFEDGIREFKDMVAPTVFHVQPDSIYTGDGYRRTLYFTAFPPRIGIGWLNRVFLFAGNFSISIFAIPYDVRVADSNLQNQEMKLRITLQNRDVPDYQRQRDLDEIVRLRESIAYANERIWQFGIYITLFSRTEEQLDRDTHELESIIGSISAQSRIAVYAQRQGFETTLPGSVDRLKFQTNATTSAISTCFPFINSQVISIKGDPIFWGTSTGDGGLVVFDPFNMDGIDSYSWAVSGKTGKGKSMSIKTYATILRLMGRQVIIFDPSGEYLDLCKRIGGEVIDLSADSKTALNVFDVAAYETGEGDSDILSDKINTLFSFISGLLQGDGTERITGTQKTVIMKAIEAAYKTYGITHDPESVYSDKTVDDDKILIGRKTLKPMPTMLDFYNELKNPAYGADGETLANMLYPYAEGPYSNLFNRRSNVDVMSPFIVFNIANLKGSMKEVMLFAALEFVWTRVRLERKNRMIFIDEAWLMLKSKDTARYLSEIIRQCRKLATGVCCAVQQVSDFFGENNEFGEVIYNNCEVKMFFGQDEQHIKRHRDKVSMSDAEMAYVIRAMPGEALLMAGKSHIPLRVEVPPDLYKIFNTNPREIEEAKRDLAKAREEGTAE